MNWREVPFARLLLPFVSGILLAIYLPWHPKTLAMTIGLVIIAAWLVYLNIAKIAWRSRWAYGAAVSIFLTWLGWQITHLHHELNKPNHFQNNISEENTVVGTIQIIQATSTGKARLQLRIKAINDSTDTLQATRGYLLAYLDSSALNQLAYGDQVSLVASITEIEPPKNPKAFDFSRYMHFKNVHYQAFVKPGNWQLSEKGKGWHPFLLADRLQKRFIRILHKNIPEENEFAVASALILGYRDEISEEINTAYRNTGATHVLAVSGMHVGFIYIGISFLLSLIKSNRRSWKIAKIFIELFSIWAFSFITGGAASILRAATMFSFIIIGKAIQRNANIYNTLAASAFFLLCINPYYIMDVGFQLSYLALIGIIYFEPKIYRCWYIKYKVGDYLWKLVAVSLAAQLVTLPISLYYFHQFPWYFWLSGLVVVPISVIVLGAGFLLFFIDFIPILGWLVGKAIWIMVWLINNGIFLIEKIPGATTTGIWINFLSVLLLYFIIMAIVISIETRQFRWVLAALSCLLLLSCSYVITQWNVHQQSLLTIYYVSKHTAIDYFDGKRLIELTDNDTNEKILNFANQNYRWYRRGEWQESLKLDGTGVYRFGNLKMAVVDKVEKSNRKTKVDCVLIRNNSRASLIDLLQIFDCKHIILDASNSRRNAARWRKECAEQGFSLYDVQAQGSLVLNLKNPLPFSN
ncbi:MAG: ComEC/Rec2 family competence protein [Saprospiraceae bacterium]|nr:ComEC/Rec2 family competence protein [Saprospiraceae bacterium]